MSFSSLTLSLTLCHPSSAQLWIVAFSIPFSAASGRLSRKEDMYEVTMPVTAAKAAGHQESVMKRQGIGSS